MPDGVIANVKRKVAAAPIVDLRRRVGALEAEVQECRALGLRVAELTDIITELLVPLAEGDTERAREIAARFHSGL